MKHTVTIVTMLLSFGGGWLTARMVSAAPDESLQAAPSSVSTERLDDERAESSASPSQGATAASSGRSSGRSTMSLRELLAASGRVSALRASLGELDPGEEPWPDEVPAVLEPEAFESELHRVMEAIGFGELETLQCEEYPCVATLTLADVTDTGGKLMDLTDLMDIRAALEEDLEMPIDAFIQNSPSGSWLTLGAHPSDINGARLSQRLEDAWADAAQ
jgi:hypothetical protein